jgi:hypothetical protein
VKRVAAVLTALAATTAGCGLQHDPVESGGLQLTVTRDFGNRQVAQTPNPPGGDTIGAVLRRSARVGSAPDGALHVNGIAAETKDAVHGGDRVWFDRHTPATRVPAVIGSFPEPFAHGVGGRRLPTRVECAEPGSASCRAVVQGLRDVGVVAGIAAQGASTGPETLRVLVGRWSSLRTEPAAGQLERGPGDSGVFARPSADGRTIAALDPRGRTKRTLGAGTGLVAATAVPGEQPTWLVTGTDDTGVAAAARAFAAGESALSDKFALAVSDDRPIGLPVVP